jgi:predicted O-linked N-acetylglucosamine transferase (SPINDLY family)
MDYYIVEPKFAPVGKFDDQFTEKLIYVPVTVPFAHPKSLPDIATLPAIANNYFTFGSFNRISKINSSVLDLWCEVLIKIPTSKMIIGGVPESMFTHLKQEFSLRNIEISRINLVPRQSTAFYLETHNKIDLILDTFPYSGGTTTYHAISMGVPVLTLTGPTLPSRQSIALQEHLGLHEFITLSREEYIDKAIYWSENIIALNFIRINIRNRMNEQKQLSQLSITKFFEKALSRVWEFWCDGNKPISFEIH